MSIKKSALALCMLLGAAGGISVGELAYRHIPASRKSSISRAERESRNKTKKAARKARAKNRRR